MNLKSFIINIPKVTHIKYSKYCWKTENILRVKRVLYTVEANIMFVTKLLEYIIKILRNHHNLVK